MAFVKRSYCTSFVFQVHGHRAKWEDPTEWVIHSSPWTERMQKRDWPSLLHLRPEDVGYDSHGAAASGASASSSKASQSDMSSTDGQDPLVSTIGPITHSTLDSVSMPSMPGFSLSLFGLDFPMCTFFLRHLGFILDPSLSLSLSLSLRKSMVSPTLVSITCASSMSSSNHFPYILSLLL